MEKRAYTIASWLLVCCLISFSAYRAYHLSLTCDEAWTYHICVKESYKTLIINDQYVSSNNHILNSIWIKANLTIFGNSEFSLRWPNVFAHLLFIFFSYLLLHRFIDKAWLRFFIFLILHANPYMLDFFSLARGYGLALGFEMMSIYYFFLFIEGKKNKPLIVSLIAASLAVYANFSLLNYYVALVGGIGAYVLWERFDKTAIKWLVISVLVSGFLFAIIYTPLQRMFDTDQFYFVGDTSLWQDTLMATVTTYFYKTYSLNHRLVLSVFIVLASFLAFIAAIVRIMRSEAYHPAVGISLVFGLAVLSPVLQHIFFDSFFPKERYAQFYVPLFVLTLGFLVDHFSQTAQGERVVKVICLIGLGFLMVHLSHSLNLSYTKDWAYDAAVKQAFQDIEQDLHEKGNFPLNSLSL